MQTRSTSLISSPDIAARESMTTSTIALAPLPSLMLAAIIAGPHPVQAFALTGSAVCMLAVKSDFNWIRQAPEKGNLIRRELRVAKRATTVQQIGAVTAIPTVAHDAYRLAKHAQNTGGSVLTGVSLAFSLAVIAGLSANAVRAQFVKSKIKRELRMLDLANKMTDTPGQRPLPLKSGLK